MDSGGGGGGGDESISTVSKEDNNMVLSSEASSSYPDESDIELGLGLSLGGVSSSKSNKTPSWGQYAKILTAKDFASMVSSTSSASSCSFSSAAKANNASCGTKRAADSGSPPRSGVSQVVGWPPVRTYRMNTIVNQTKSPLAEEFSSTTDKCKRKIVTNVGSSKTNSFAKEKGVLKTSLFVKVNMDGIAIGRKVDLNAHSNYGNLAQTLDNMFLRSSTTVCARSSNAEAPGNVSETTPSSRLLEGSSEYVLTYEDKDGDWMLVGDVPWEMFPSSVKRLRIMRTSDAKGLGTSPSVVERNGRSRTKPV